MNEVIYVPLFPLRILPLPGELVPLHIFEPRYKQLLNDAELDGIEFGIFSSHPANSERFGTMVSLEQVIRRNRGGNSDIVVRARRIFSLLEMDKCHPGKWYPGGRVEIRSTEADAVPNESLLRLFRRFQRVTKQYQRSGEVSLYDVGVGLGLGLPDRLTLISGNADDRHAFLRERITFELHLWEASERAKDIFHLN